MNSDGIKTIVKEKWEAQKPLLKGLAMGIVAGPVITSLIGWTVTTGFMEDQTHKAVVKTESSICAALARADGRDTTKLDWTARSKIAEKYSIMPGQKPGSADSDVMRGCTERLSEAPGVEAAQM